MGARLPLAAAIVLVGAAPGFHSGVRHAAQAGAIDSATWTALLAAEDARARGPEQLAVLVQGTRHADSLVRRLAVRALGRLERTDVVPDIRPLLNDPAPGVRAEAGNAWAQALTRTADVAAPPDLLTRVRVESDPWARGVLAAAIGRLVYSSVEDVRLAEQALRDAIVPAGDDAILGVARGFESSSRRQARFGVAADAATRTILASLVGYGMARERPKAASVRALTLRALLNLGDVDEGRLRVAGLDRDPQVRRLVMVAAGGLDANPTADSLLRVGLRDPAAMVRYEALRALRRHDAMCMLAPTMVEDPNPHVALFALDLLAACPDAVAVIEREVQREISDSAWHRPAHALVALARVDPAAARHYAARFTSSAVWWARMYAARALTELGDAEALRSLAADPHHNVRHEAVEGLRGVEGHDADDVYLAQLRQEDPQLLMAAARGLQESPLGDGAVPPLLDALARVSALRRETSRDVRRTILTIVADLSSGIHAATVEPYLHDFDPVIADLAAETLAGWTGRDVNPDPAPLAPVPLPTLRDVGELAATRPVIVMERGGEIELRLFPMEAPTNAARFVRLARAGYFDGLTFHRVVPAFVVQGGSPGANEYWGDGPYTRDELGTRSHTRGTVGVSTRGTDTGDGQIFINLVDNVRLDHEYTVFAEVVRGMEVVDGLLEGAVISTIEWR